MILYLMPYAHCILYIFQKNGMAIFACIMQNFKHSNTYTQIHSQKRIAKCGVNCTALFKTAKTPKCLDVELLKQKQTHPFIYSYDTSVFLVHRLFSICFHSGCFQAKRKIQNRATRSDKVPSPLPIVC